MIGYLTYLQMFGMCLRRFVVENWLGLLQLDHPGSGRRPSLFASSRPAVNDIARCIRGCYNYCLALYAPSDMDWCIRTCYDRCMPMWKRDSTHVWFSYAHLLEVKWGIPVSLTGDVTACMGLNGFMSLSYTIFYTLVNLVSWYRRRPIVARRQLEYENGVPHEHGASILELAISEDWNWKWIAREERERRFLAEHPSSTVPQRRMGEAELRVSDICFICHDHFRLGETVPDVPHPCIRNRNFMHQVCLDNWFTTILTRLGSYKCPVCRQDIGHCLRP